MPPGVPFEIVPYDPFERANMLLQDNAITRTGGSQPLALDLDLGTHKVTFRNSAEVLNAAAFGAKGDDAFDNTAVINAMIAAIPAGGAVLVFGPGTYRASGPFSLPYGTSIIGAGLITTKFRNMADADFWYSIYPGTQVLVFRDFSVYDGFGAGRTQGAGIHLDGDIGTAQAEITNVMVLSHWDGFLINRGLFSTIRNCRAATNKRYGFHFTGATTSMTLISCFASTNGSLADRLTSGGYFFDDLGHNSTSWGTRYSSLVSCAADSNYGIGYKFWYAHDITMLSPGCEHRAFADGGDHSISITGGMNFAINNPVIGAGDDGINVVNASGVMLNGGLISSVNNNAITLSGSSAITLVTPGIETPGTDGIWIGNVCSAVLIINPVYYGAPGGVQINDAAAIATTLRSGVLNLAATLRARGATVAVAAGEVGIGASTAAGAGAASGVYWRININGTFYKVALLADA